MDPSPADPGDWGNPSTEWRPLVVATSRHGLAEGEVAPSKTQPEDLISSATSEGSHKVRHFCEWRNLHFHF